jgi:predicted nucleic acid-binding Zn ribbon protein
MPKIESKMNCGFCNKEIIKNKKFCSNSCAASFNNKKYKDLRINYQNNGRRRVWKENSLYLAGCMLYWGEGAKDKNSVRLTNSNQAMLLLFKKFLMAFFDIKKEEIVLTINCYTDLHTFSEIEEYWLSILNLERSNLRKSQINNLPKSSKNSKVSKSEWGTACLMVHKTNIVQEIFGAIQEYASFSNENWLDK